MKPIDEEGNALSFVLDTRWAEKYLAANKENNSSEGTLTKNPQNGCSMTTETLKITRAITSTIENRTTLQIYILPGPENSSLSSSVTLRWLHLHGDTLDWGSFKVRPFVSLEFSR